MAYIFSDIFLTQFFTIVPQEYPQKVNEKLEPMHESWPTGIMPCFE